jgi:hypothetical protein
MQNVRPSCTLYVMLTQGNLQLVVATAITENCLKFHRRAAGRIWSLEYTVIGSGRMSRFSAERCTTGLQYAGTEVAVVGFTNLSAPFDV